MIKMIACDIDGTLLRNGEISLAPSLLKEIERLLEKGVLFCPASGRQYACLRRLFEPLSSKLSYLCENGAIVYGPGDPGNVLSQTVMNRTLAIQLSEEILEISECEVLISGANTSYLCPKHSDIVAHVHDFVGNNLVVVSTPQQVEEHFLKVSAYCRQGTARIEPLLTPRWANYFQVAVGGNAWLDFTSADKGIGLRQMCTALNVQLDEVMAFGDNYNDLPMLTIVGQPYLMASAHEDLKKIISHHCECVEEILGLL